MKRFFASLAVAVVGLLAAAESASAQVVVPDYGTDIPGLIESVATKVGGNVQLALIVMGALIAVGAGIRWLRRGVRA